MIGVVSIGVTGVNTARNGASLVPKLAMCCQMYYRQLDAACRLPRSCHLSITLGVLPRRLCARVRPLLVRSSPAARWILTQFTDSMRRGEITWSRSPPSASHLSAIGFSTIVFFVAYQRDVDPSGEVCLERGLEPGFTVPVHVMFVVVTVGLCLFKVIAVCECLCFSILPPNAPNRPLRRTLHNV